MSIEQQAQEIVQVAKKDLDAMISYLVTRPWQEVAHLLKISPPVEKTAPEVPSVE